MKSLSARFPASLGNFFILWWMSRWCRHARTAPTKTMSMMTAMLMTAACYHHDVFRISLNSVATLTITGVNTSGTKLFVR